MTKEWESRISAKRTAAIGVLAGAAVTITAVILIAGFPGSLLIGDILLDLPRSRADRFLVSVLQRYSLVIAITLILSGASIAGRFWRSKPCRPASDLRPISWWPWVLCLWGLHGVIYILQFNHDLQTQGWNGPHTPWGVVYGMASRHYAALGFVLLVALLTWILVYRRRSGAARLQPILLTGQLVAFTTCDWLFYLGLMWR